MSVARGYPGDGIVWFTVDRSMTMCCYHVRYLVLMYYNSRIV